MLKFQAFPELSCLPAPGHGCLPRVVGWLAARRCPELLEFREIVLDLPAFYFDFLRFLLGPPWQLPGLPPVILMADQ